LKSRLNNNSQPLRASNFSYKFLDCSIIVSDLLKVENP
jgi:hypothetical protein